jgi:hypothetical protein
MKIFPVILSFFSATLLCAQSGGDLSGVWQFTVKSTNTNVQYSALGQISEFGNNLSGQLSFTGAPCATSAPFSGTLSTLFGLAVTFQVNENGQLVSFIGTAAADGNTASGNYSAPGGGCLNSDVGVWTARRLATVNSPYRVVIPQLVDGAGWKSTLKFVNMENHPVSFTVQFFGDDGHSLFIPVVGFGVASNVAVTLPAAGSTSIETPGTIGPLQRGWAGVVLQNPSDSLGGFAVFRQTVPGIPDQEAIAPAIGQFSGPFAVVFDNTSYATAVALANPSGTPLIVPVTIRNEQGSVIDRESYALGPFGHAAFAIASQWPSTAVGRGTLEFDPQGFGLGAVGLRFNGSVFTSFDMVQHFNWP